jgi:hypothetical protein
MCMQYALIGYLGWCTVMVWGTGCLLPTSSTCAAIIAHHCNVRVCSIGPDMSGCMDRFIYSSTERVGGQLRF